MRNEKLCVSGTSCSPCNTFLVLHGISIHISTIINSDTINILHLAILNGEATHLLGKEGISSSTTPTITEPPSSVSDAVCSSFTSGHVNRKHHKIYKFLIICQNGKHNTH